MKIGIIKETKIPGDSRAPLTPDQAAHLIREQKMDLVVQSSTDRIFTDEEYRSLEVPVVNDVSDRDILLGVKEVKEEELIPGKTYFFFSHTIKAQPYNRDLLRETLKKEIKLIDYEVLTDETGSRLIAFGRFAGIVGAHNAIMTFGRREELFDLPRLKDLKDYREAREIYKSVKIPPMKVILTGKGRVGGGAAEVLTDMGFGLVSPDKYLNNSFNSPVYCHIGPEEYVRHSKGSPFDRDHFYQYPEEYESAFEPFMEKSDIFINGIYWDKKAPAFFTAEEMRSEKFGIEVIADITCDIAPESSVPSTLRPSTIDDPVYGYNPFTEKEVAPFLNGAVDVMAIDNLPNELPRDASESFGKQFIDRILPELFRNDSEIIKRATIAENGALGDYFTYLQDYVG
nr:alanine dehydrogenase [Saprospiraceae bacterium]